MQRDRHAHYMSTLALIATSIEKMAVEIRGLQKSETREVEAFAKGQKVLLQCHISVIQLDRKYDWFSSCYPRLYDDSL